jgi:hypothetical protein
MPKRCPNAAQSLFNRCAIAVQTLRKRCANTTRTLRKRCANAVQSLHKRNESAAQTLRNRYPNATQMLCEMLCNRCAIAAQTLRKRCANDLLVVPNFCSSFNHASTSTLPQQFDKAAGVLVRSENLSPDEKVALGTIKRYGVVADAIIMVGGLGAALKAGGITVAGGGGTLQEGIEDSEGEVDPDELKV